MGIDDIMASGSSLDNACVSISVLTCKGIDTGFSGKGMDVKDVFTRAGLNKYTCADRHRLTIYMRILVRTGITTHNLLAS